MKPIPPSSDRIRTPIVVALVAAIHLLAFGGFSLLQGCATRAPRTGSNASTAIASSRGASRAPVEEIAPAPRTPSTPASSSSAPSREPAPRVATATPATVSVVPMPPRAGDRPAASFSSAPAPSAGATSTGLKSFTPPPFVPASGAVKTPAAPRTPAATATPAAGTQKYVVQSGESLSVIAQKHGVKTRDLMELNGLSDANKVRVGQPLLVPANAKTPAGALKPAGEAAPSIKSSAPAATPLVNGAGSGTHKVKPGDALSKIAKQYGTTTAELRKLNNLSSDSIRVDQTLKLPGASAAAPSATHSVAILDVGTKVPALASAASTGTRKVSPSEIDTILGPDPARRAVTGTTTRIEEVLEAESPDEPASPIRDTPGLGGITLKPTEYKILPGDTVGKLAVIFLSSEAEIRRLNGLGPSQEVKAGDTILIPPPKDP